MSRNQRAVVSYIEHNPKFAAFATASELAGRSGAHPSTVVRLARALGYAGFPVMQEAIRRRCLASLDAVALMEATNRLFERLDLPWHGADNPLAVQAERSETSSNARTPMTSGAATRHER